ncbi:MAG: DUF4358 domain-containing protein [Lachnospiraceae bacterium]|nr:DUF4358 domain-containing protein [Lachnospiraceae bacterium]
MKKVILAEVLLVLLLAGVMVLLLYKKEPKDVPLAQVREAVLASCDLDGLEEAKDMRLKRAFGLNVSDYDEYLYFAPDNTMSVNEFLVIKTSDPSQLPAVRAGIEARLEAEKKAFDGYGVNQTELLNSAKLIEEGRYIIFSCGEHADAFVKAARETWR